MNEHRTANVSWRTCCQGYPMDLGMWSVDVGVTYHLYELLGVDIRDRIPVDVLGEDASAADLIVYVLNKYPQVDQVIIVAHRPTGSHPPLADSGRRESVLR